MYLHYLFNVTNPRGVIEGGEKPHLAEVGPFAYWRNMSRVRVSFAEGTRAVEFVEYRCVHS